MLLKHRWHHRMRFRECFKSSNKTTLGAVFDGFFHVLLWKICEHLIVARNTGSYQILLFLGGLPPWIVSPG